MAIFAPTITTNKEDTHTCVAKSQKKEHKNHQNGIFLHKKHLFSNKILFFRQQNLTLGSQKNSFTYTLKPKQQIY